jgi:hypothetical protein
MIGHTTCPALVNKTTRSSLLLLSAHMAVGARRKLQQESEACQAALTDAACGQMELMSVLHAVLIKNGLSNVLRSTHSSPPEQYHSSDCRTADKPSNEPRHVELKITCHGETSALVAESGRMASSGGATKNSNN